jgi:uncharacterized protein (DUF1330 family)
MKTKTVAMLAAVASLGIGAFGVAAIHAQTPTQPLWPAFYVAKFEVTDAEGIRPYSQQVEAMFMPFSGRYVARSGKTVSLEGEALKRIVMIAFDSMEQAQAWHNSPAYRAIRPIRYKSTTSRVYIVERAPQARPQ